MNFFKKSNSLNKLYNPSFDLTSIANSLETDKGDANKMSLSWGKDWPDHNCMGYTNTYEKYMKPYREKDVKLFEIGVCDKRFPYASCKMWMTYFKNIDLYAVDNFWGSYLEEKKHDIKNLNELGINFIYADQGNFCDWNEIKNEKINDIDFIVEDGSHWPNHMAVSLWQSKDLLKKDGYYFMEDLQHPIFGRGKFKFDNSLLTEDLLTSQHSKKLTTHFLNDQQNKEVNESFQLLEMVLDSESVNYLAVFKKLT